MLPLQVERGGVLSALIGEVLIAALLILGVGASLEEACLYRGIFAWRIRANKAHQPLVF